VNKVILKNGKVVHLKDQCVDVDVPVDNTLLYILIALGVLILLKD
jgi:hypothetical protein